MTSPLPSPTPEERMPLMNLTDQIQVQRKVYKYGGFSAVHIGTWITRSGDQRKVAVKVLRASGGGSNEIEVIKRRLNRESRVWHEIDHKYILKFLGIYQDEDDEISAMVSPFCHQGNVVDYLRQHPEGIDRSKMIFHISQALEYLHSKNVVHGDLKGTNVLIDDNGSPLLSDFGRSKVLDKHGFTTGWSGSPRYLAPELLDAPDNASSEEKNNFIPSLTKESDVYAFGMVGLEILTGDAPFALIKNDYMVIAAVSQGRRPPRPTLQSARRNMTWDVLDRCWERNPASRPEMGIVVRDMRLLPL